MTKEERELLLKDLCARLPYGVKVEIDGYNISVLKGIDGDTISTDRGINYPLRLVKPFLRPMSSMTEEEAEDYFKNSEYESSECYEAGANYEPVTVKAACSADEACVNTDWLNAHHFDYRGLIPMGLALEAPEGMY